MRRHIIYTVIAVLMLANVACRTKRETTAEQKSYHTEESEHIAVHDSVRDTISIDLELRLEDVNLRVGSATLTASAAKVNARVGRNRRQVRQIEMSDTTSVVHTAVTTQKVETRPRRRPWWLLTVALGVAAAVVTLRYVKKTKTGAADNR